MENKSIGCNVTECQHHAKSKNLCTLEHIEVVKHHNPAATQECTDCGSFERQ